MQEDILAPMGRGATRTFERHAASMLNLIDGSSIEFKECRDVPNGGALLALPALLANGLLEHSEKAFQLPQGYYRLSSIFIFIAFAALLRIKTIEDIRQYAPGEFGKLLGLDRAPEIKTLQEKLSIIAKQNKENLYGSALSKQWLEANNKAIGILYVDGQVRVYHGNNTELPKRYISRERLCLPGITDYWINDIIGQPFFYISSQVNQGLIQMLKDEIIPRLKKDVPNQPSKEELAVDEKKCRFTIVFDREGYSPEAFKEYWEERVAIISYKKNVVDKWEETEFKKCKVKTAFDEEIEMLLCEKEVELNGIIKVREIRKLTEHGRQIAIITTNFNLKKEEIAVCMFARWSQENFFKYMSEHFNINRLSEYGLDNIPETKKIVNPEYRELSKKIKIQNSTLSSAEIKFAKIVIEEEKESESEDKKLKKFVFKKSMLLEKIEDLKKTIEDLKNQRKNVKQHITVSELPENKKFSGLLQKKKQIVDLIKMVAYRSEVALSLILKEFRPKDDSLKHFLRGLFKTEIDINPIPEKKILQISLHNLSNNSADESAKFLLDKLNETETVFPGTNLVLSFKLVSTVFP